MGNCDGKNQRDRETKTRPARHDLELTLAEFWRDQLNRLKEYAESQPIKPESRCDESLR